MFNNKILSLCIIIILGLGVTILFANQFYPKEESRTLPQPEPQPTPIEVKLNSTLWYDNVTQSFWIELRNQYLVEAYNLSLKVFESEMVWNEEQEQWERARIEKDVSLPFTLEPNETVSFFIRDYYEDFYHSYRDPEIYGYVIF